MSKPLGECPVCKKNIMPGQDAVVCPDCGAPYHRECYLSQGQCSFTDKHGAGFEFKPQGAAPSGCDGGSGAQDAATMACPSCGQTNLERGIFCENCGSPLHGQPAGGTAFGQGQPGGFGTGGIPQPGMPLNYQPVDMTGEIDGIPKKDWATYVGTNANVYLTRMGTQDMRKSKTSYMFSAFLVPQYYFAYRKMWGWAVAAILLVTALTMPYMIALYMEEAQMASLLGFSVDQVYNFGMICYVLCWAVQFVCGFFALHFYRRQGAKKIKSLRETSSGEEEYQQALAKKGGTSVVGLLLFMAVNIALNFLVPYLLGFNVMSGLPGLLL